MKIIIENGATIIKTGDAVGGIKNKYNKTGVSKHIEPNGKVKYRAVIQFNKKTYYLGIRNTPDEAYLLRLEAEKSLSNGNFIEWYEKMKKSRHTNRYN